MIDLVQELSGALPDHVAAAGELDRARSTARRRRGRRRAAYAVASVAVVVAVVVGVSVAWLPRKGPADLATGPGVGADAPTSLTVTCTTDGPLLSSDTVQVGPGGVAIEYRNATDVPTNVALGSGDGRELGASGRGLPPGAAESALELTRPGPATITCGSGRSSSSSAPVLLADPNGYYGAASLDLECDGPGTAVVDLTGDGAPNPSAEAPLLDLLSPAALADHDIEPAGYPDADPRPYAVRRNGKTVAVGGFHPSPDGLVLVELLACADVLHHH